MTSKKSKCNISSNFSNWETKLTDRLVSAFKRTVAKLSRWGKKSRIKTLRWRNLTTRSMAFMRSSFEIVGRKSNDSNISSIKKNNLSTIQIVLKIISQWRLTHKIKKMINFNQIRVLKMPQSSLSRLKKMSTCRVSKRIGLGWCNLSSQLEENWVWEYSKLYSNNDIWNLLYT
jgi:hypothetical protein